MQLTPDENSKQTGRRKKDDAVRYQSDNRIIIQPLNVKEQKSAGLSSLINIAIGLIIGLAVMYFLVVPAAVSNANNEGPEDHHRHRQSVRHQDLPDPGTGDPDASTADRE